MAVISRICLIIIFLQWTMRTSTASEIKTYTDRDGTEKRVRIYHSYYKLCSNADEICFKDNDKDEQPGCLGKFLAKLKGENKADLNKLLEGKDYIVKNQILEQVKESFILGVRDFANVKKVIFSKLKKEHEFSKQVYKLVLNFVAWNWVPLTTSKPEIFNETGVYNEFIKMMKEKGEQDAVTYRIHIIDIYESNSLV